MEERLAYTRSSILNPKTGDQSSVVSFELFLDHYYSGEYQSAIDMGIQLLDSLYNKPVISNLLSLLWRAHSRLKNLPRYKILLSRLMERYPNFLIKGWAQSYLAYIMADGMQLDEALKLYQNIAAAFPNTSLEAKALYEQVLVYLMELDDHKTAANILLILQQKHPNSTYTKAASELYATYTNTPRTLENIVGVRNSNKRVVGFRLHQNYPNPFNPTTTISFNLPEDNFVDLKIYDISGRRIRTLVASNMQAGKHRLIWDGQDENGNHAASGVYFYRIQAGRFIAVNKMMLLR